MINRGLFYYLRNMLKGLRPVLEGFVFTMASGLDVLFIIWSLLFLHDINFAIFVYVQDISELLYLEQLAIYPLHGRNKLVTILQYYMASYDLANIVTYKQDTIRIISTNAGGWWPLHRKCCSRIK